VTAKQRIQVVQAVLEEAAYHIGDEYGEPLKDIDQSKYWPTSPESDGEEAAFELDDQCMAYLDTAIKKAQAEIRKIIKSLASPPKAQP